MNIDVKSGRVKAIKDKGFLVTKHPSKLGPVLGATLVASDISPVVAAYCDYLYMHVSADRLVTREEATSWGAPALSGNRLVTLANTLGQTWLRIIEDPDAIKPEPLKRTGWLSLEILVEDVDALAKQLTHSPFNVLRPVANLDMSDDIRAVQIEGLAGEVLYLTTIKADVPGFDLPRAECAVDHLFIPVLASHDRNRSLAFYEKLADHQGLSFETKITVINQGYGYDLEKKHPVATLQLAGETLIEIDELPEAEDLTCGEGHLPAGIAMVQFGSQKITENQTITGPSGEKVELLPL